MTATATTYGQKLTAQELNVVAGAARGRTAREIGKRLGITESTVRTYFKRIYIKLGARDKAHAVTIAFVRRHLILPPPNAKVERTLR